MPSSLDVRYHYCPRVQESVCICRSEQQCRAEYGCSQPDCPLEKMFGLPAFDARMRAYATAFDLWPLGGLNSPDFP
jgi:hypothetical protein